MTKQDMLKTLTRYYVEATTAQRLWGLSIASHAEYVAKEDAFKAYRQGLIDAEAITWTEAFAATNYTVSIKKD